MNLTPCQLRVLDYLREFIAANQVAPTIQKIADDLGCSKTTVFEHLTALQKKGCVRRTGGSRGIELVDPSQPSIDLIRRTEAALRSGGCYPNIAKEWLVFLDAAPAAGVTQ